MLFWLPLLKFCAQALLLEYCVISCNLRRRAEGLRQSVRKLRQTSQTGACGIHRAHIRCLMGMWHDQIQIALEWPP
jgi:hypothetical protein